MLMASRLDVAVMSSKLTISGRLVKAMVRRKKMPMVMATERAVRSMELL